ncbi:MAG TPA: nucleoside 2-deoxyribosyltransferase [Candidatus Saccharimonadales bacterium]|nr:nucleoside 2-deoxyribosyltransferase [Candidatus Saccharimonadales bacterium]
MKIVICASFSFYEHVAELADDLLDLGFEPIIPRTARSMKATGDFSKDPLRTATGEFSDYSQKARVMHEHFDEIKVADAILVVNDEKHGQANYIGPNVLMEMGLAFALGKPIYLLNKVPEQSPWLEEIRGLQPEVLRGNLHAII